MYSRDPYRGRRMTFGGSGLSGGPPPRDLIVILAALFVTFTFQFFEGTDAIPRLLRLSGDAWRRGFIWQPGTYAFVGTGRPDFWFLLELLILFWFGRDVYGNLGERKARKLLVAAVLGAAAAALIVQAAFASFSVGGRYEPFLLMQGQRTILAVFIAAFAVLNAQATIYLFFVLPVQAKHFLWIEIVLAFFGFLSTRDLGGFIGVCSAVGITWGYLTPGGPRQRLRHWRLQWRRRKISREIEQLKKKKGFRVVGDDEGGNRWMN